MSTFFGRVHPERTNITIDELPPLKIGPTMENLVDVTVRVLASQVTITTSGKVWTLILSLSVMRYLSWQAHLLTFLDS
ncbi:hypothetical protein AYO38_02295 [bacterium SCGC AG-212-C10]|nr:hypothetical protein AYO38_02295 [bacterium SCGC AG-212-C10]